MQSCPRSFVQKMFRDVEMHPLIRKIGFIISLNICDAVIYLFLAGKIIVFGLDIYRLF